MVFYTLGVTPAEPGYATARVAPSLGSLQWARGSVSTPHGLIGPCLEAGHDDGRSIMADALRNRFGLSGRAARQLVEELEQARTIQYLSGPHHRWSRALLRRLPGWLPGC